MASLQNIVNLRRLQPSLGEARAHRDLTCTGACCDYNCWPSGGPPARGAALLEFPPAAQKRLPI